MSDTLDMLYDEANDNNIDIVDYHFSDTKKAMCIHEENCFKAIALDKPQITSTAEEKTLLCEELSHYETGNLYFIEATADMPNGKVNKMIHEARTKHHAIKKYLPFDKLRDTLHSGYTEIYEIADYLELTESFVKSAITYYTKNCGLSFE